MFVSLLQSSIFQEWMGFGEFFRTLEFNAIYSWYVYETSLLGTVLKCLPTVIWYCVENRLKEYISLKKSVPCLVIVVFCLWKKTQNFAGWNFGKKRKTIALLCKGSDQSSGNRSLKNIERNLLKRFKQDLQKESIQLEEKPWDKDLDDGQQPVIVFCVISSRIGTDIENAMRGVHGNSRVILVILHCVLSTLLRGDLSDDEELLDPTMINRMAGIAHFAFSDHEGLYECQQNSNGFGKLCCIISSFCSLSSREGY